MQKGNTLIFLLVGILVIAVTGGSYYLGTKKSSTLQDTVSRQNPVILPSISPQSNNKSTPDTKPQNDETGNWKTYTGRGYEFKYPSNGHVVTEKSSVVYISYEDNTKPYFTFTVNIADNPNHLTTKQVVDKIIDELRNNRNSPSAKTQADQTLQTMKGYTNGQVTGIKLQSFDEGYPQKFGEVIEAKEDSIYTFYIGDGSGGGVSDSEERLLDKILSTFKFL